MTDSELEQEIKALSPEQLDLAVGAFIVGQGLKLVKAAKAGEAAMESWQTWADEYIALAEEWITSDGV